MATTNNLGITTLSENQAQKYVTINTALQALEDALTDVSASYNIGASDAIALTEAQFAADFAFLFGNGGIDASGTVSLPEIQRGLFVVTNSTGQTLTIEITGQSETSPTLSDGTTGLFYCDGVDVYKVVDFGGGGGGSSTLLSLTDTPSSFSGSGLKLLRVNSAANAVEFSTPSVEIAGQVSGTPTGSAKVMEKLCSSLTFSLPSSLTGSVGYLATAPSGSAINFDIQKNGSSIGTMSFADGANTATFTFASTITFASGDRLTIVAPASLASAADLSFAFVATRTA